MTRSLDSTAVIPLYHQLKEIILENIESGLWRRGDTIPSENQLVEQYGISRNTAKRAIETLVQQGVLYRIQGRGTFVAMPKLEQSLTEFYSFSRVMKEKGLASRDIVLGVTAREAGGSVARRLQISDNDEVLELRRLRCMENDPFVLETSYLPRALVKDLATEWLGTSSLYDLLRDRYGIIVVKAKESFEPVLISKYEAQLLQTTEGYPGLLLHRVAYSSTGTIVEYCKSIVRGDKCLFYTELL